MKTLVDVIIPVYNRGDLVVECLNALPVAFGDIKYKIIIQDNGSSLEERVKYGDLARDMDSYINRSSTNLGFPAGCNAAAKKGQSPLIFLLNDDVTLFPRSMEHLVKAMDDPKVGVAGMKLLFPKDSIDQTRPAGKVQHVGISTNIRGDVFHHLMAWDADHPKVNSVRDCMAVTGAALLTRRSLWNRIGGLDEIYGQGTYEDISYCMDISKLGYNVIVEPKAVGYHQVGATAISQKIGYPLGKNKMIFLQKWQPQLVWSEWEIW